MSNDSFEPPWRAYWHVLFPDVETAHWYAQWKTSEMCIGLFRERQVARQKWFRNRQGRDFVHPTAVVTYHASPVRSMTVKVCLQCLWVSADLDALHDQSA